MAAPRGEKQRVAVIGAGIFGAMIALNLHARGYRVSLIERSGTILGGASHNNQNRLHLGFHYPRDMETAQQCVRGFDRFIDEFPDCIYGAFPNAYFIAAHGSLTSPESYLDFCHRLGQHFEPFDQTAFPVEVCNVVQGIMCEEVIYDCGLLRSTLSVRFQKAGLDLRLDTEVKKIQYLNDNYLLQCEHHAFEPFDAVVNATYADINRLTAQLGHKTPAHLYEYTVVPVIDVELPPLGVTIMDGPFMTLLPYGKTGKFLLYHVQQTVIACETSKQINSAWLEPRTSPFDALDPAKFFEEIRDACVMYLPALKQAAMVGILKGPRMVLAQRDKTDARPSIIDSPQPGYFTVFSGKIDHSIWVAEEIIDRLDGYFS